VADPYLALLAKASPRMASVLPIALRSDRLGTSLFPPEKMLLTYIGFILHFSRQLLTALCCISLPQ
jgi:hypothetical protein